MTEPSLAARMGAASARGVVAAMAMTGMRRMTVGLGLLPEPPPEEIVEAMPGVLARVPPERRDEAIELLHWAYGGLAGAPFAALPAAFRRRWWAGPAYGLASWVLFERALAPLLGLRLPHQRTVTERVATAADHALYGFVVGAWPRRV